MLFNSFTFIEFFAVVLILHNLPISWKLRKFNLLVASYIFYAAWNPPFVILLWISTIIDWYCSKALGRTENLGRRRLLLAISLAGNFGLLGFFKYGQFMMDNFVALMAAIGIEYKPLPMDWIVLPVGISFYTFQTLSYTFDVYRRKAEPWKSALDFSLFVTFFPQLVAGPIIRAVDFLPQCIEPQRATARQMSWGMSLMILGLFEKVVIADSLLAPLADRVYEAPAQSTFWDAWCGTLAFSGQIFCDFAGYSTCAIGAALCLGFAIQDNFKFPYAAIGFSDFWKRWHISLSSWLRDYLYIGTLGGNRKGITRTQVNLALTMLLGGLWHGAAWTFVFWGGLHGAYLALERVLKAVVPPFRFWESLPAKLCLALATYALVCFTWVFFRAQSFGTAFTLTSTMLGIDALPGLSVLRSTEAGLVLGLTVVLLGIHWVLRDSSVEALASRVPWWAQSMCLAGFLVAIATMSGDDRAFIYFRF